jgi:hypothetical protein
MKIKKPATKRAALQFRNEAAMESSFTNAKVAPKTAVYSRDKAGNRMVSVRTGALKLKPGLKTRYGGRPVKLLFPEKFCAPRSTTLSYVYVKNVARKTSSPGRIPN